MTYPWVIIEFLVCACEIVFLYYFCKQFMEQNTDCNIYQVLVAGLLCSLVMFAATYYKIFSFWKIFLSYSLQFLFAAVLCGGPVWKKVFYTLIYYGILGFSDIAANAIVSLFAEKAFWDVSLTQDTYRMYFVVIARLIVFVLLCALSAFRSVKDSHLPMKFWFIFFFIFSASIGAIFILLNTSFVLYENRIVNSVMAVSSFILFTIFIAIFYLFAQICSYYSQANEKNMIEYQEEIMEKYVVMKENSEDILREMSHDMKHYLVELGAFLDDGNVAAAREAITGYHAAVKSADMINVGDPMGNAMINQAFTEAKQMNIKFKINGMFDSGLTISQKDLCALLGNLLDNALEASLHVQDESKREIFVNIKRDGSYLYLDVKNNYEIEPVVKNKLFITSKKNRFSHGIGIKSIHKIAEKYDGAVDMDYGRGVFKVFVVMKAYDNF